MARVTYVSNAYKPPGHCGRCGVEIKKGEPYKHASPGYHGRKLVRCGNCVFRPSELTTSKMAGVYEAQEGAHDALDDLAKADEFTDIEEVKSILEQCASEAGDIQSEYEEAAEAMGEGGGEHQEKADLIDAWADELRDLTFDDEPEWPADEKPDDEALADAWTAWREGVIETAREAIDSFEG